MTEETKRLYDADSHLFSFEATVLRCRQEKDRYLIVLDQTAFFPEGGGQPGDIGTLGEARVLDTHEKNGELLHYCDLPLQPGARVAGRVDRETRLQRMQNHSGEHIFSGTAHRLYDCTNVGFHMGEKEVTLDFDRELNAEEVRTLERLANEAVRDNIPVRVFSPTA